MKEEEDKSIRYGVIAQELEELGLNELVYEDSNGKKGVDYIGMLVLKVWQLTRDLNELRTQLDSMKQS